MVARLLNLCGLDLGPEEDLMPPGVGNEPGHWENLSFVRLNDAILTRSGGGWDLPPAPSIGWASSPELASERAEAGALLESFRRREPWGWKDPRNSLTLPFWRPLIPDLKVVICVRDPLEVADSLYHRGESSSAFSLQLWLLYNQSLLETAPSRDRVVTHYDAYFVDARAELRRLVDLLGIGATDETVERAVGSVSLGLRHRRSSARRTWDGVEPSAYLKCYAALVAEAGPVCRAALDLAGASSALSSIPASAGAEGSGEPRPMTDGVSRAELKRWALLTDRNRQIAELKDLRAAVADRDRTIEDRDRTIEDLGETLARLRAQLGQLTSELSVIQATSGWRILTAYRHVITSIGILRAAHRLLFGLVARGSRPASGGDQGLGSPQAPPRDSAR